MKKWLINAVLIGIILGGLPVWLYAEQTVSVAVFPFSVQAPSAQKSLGTDLPRMLGKRLENEGTQVVYVKEFMDTQTWDGARFRQEGIRLGVDYIITGNVFMAGNAISIDANMHPIYETGPPLPFFPSPVLWKNCMRQSDSCPGQLSVSCLKNALYPPSR